MTMNTNNKRIEEQMHQLGVCVLQLMQKRDGQANRRTNASVGVCVLQDIPRCKREMQVFGV